MRLFLILCLAMFMVSSICAEPIMAGTQARTFKASVDQTEQKYNLFVPHVHDTATSVPLVVALHGKGATWESWFAGTAVRDWAEKEGYVVITPHGRGDWFYLGPGESDVLDAMKDVQGLCKIDSSRVYLIGHSMGGFGTWSIATAHPDLFAAIVPMSTWPPAELLPNLRYLHPLMLHGDADPIVPVENSRRSKTLLDLLNIDNKYIEVAGAAHESSMISKHFDDIGDWLRGKTKVVEPDTVEICAYTPRRGKAYWLAIQEIEDFTSLARIKAARFSDRIDITTSNVTAFAVLPPPAVKGSLELTLVVNDQPVKVPTPKATQIIVATRTEKKWNARLAEAALFAPPAARRVAQSAKLPEDLPAAICRILALRCGADAVLLPRDLVAPQLASSALTEDEVLDIFMRPEDEMCRFTMTPQEYQRLAVDKEWYPTWWGELAPLPKIEAVSGRPIVVVAPRIVAARVPMKSQEMGVTLRKIVYDHVRDYGGF
ncbi:hypothetical protein BH09SUM1_BH09SUM1_09190 [soil metagenome]